MADIIGNENCVVVGRCGNNAFRHREDVISVFLTKQRKRVELIEKKHNVSPKKAAKIVEDTDLRRRSYHNYYTR
ncbi:MAG: cytidylate kinase family protein [Lachnospira eligens]